VGRPSGGEAKVKAWMEGMREAMRSAVERMAAAAHDESKQVAADMGERITNENKMSRTTVYNVVTATGREVNGGSPKLRAVPDLAKSVPPE
jgi:hypothetical protein